MSFLSRIFRSTETLPLTGMTDWHCHILPGVDDGVETLSEALAILDSYEHAGIREVWLTPHIMEDLPNTTDKLRKRFDELQSAYTGPVNLHLAAENMMDNLFHERLEAGDVLPIGARGNTLLVETSYFSAPMRLYDTLEHIKSKGFYPLLAHPERYNYITDFSTYKKMHNMGVRFQCNLMSFGGHYGPMVRDKAMRLLNEGMIDRIGSDLHRSGHINVMTSIRMKPSLIPHVTDLLNKPIK